MTRRRICIIAFKDVSSTIHVLKQIHYFAPHYELTVIGHGQRDPRWPRLAWHQVPVATFRSKLDRAVSYALGRVWPRAYDDWYWRTRRFREAYEHALRSGADAIHANDWQALPVAIEVARRTGARVVFHQHEYAELEREDSYLWRALVSPALRHLLRKYTSDPRVHLDGFITVCRPIAERYQRELGVEPMVVMNAPRPAADFEPAVRAHHGVRMVHHGYAQRGRGIDEMIRAVALAEPRFTLDLMLMGDDPAHVRDLKRLAQRIAPGRVTFRAPVPPMDIVRTVAEYDLGLCVIQPATYNARMMLPNKLFEYIQAGLAVCVGPSPAMADVVRQFNVGVVSAGFTAEDVARTLNGLGDEHLATLRAAARTAARTLNADLEMARIVDHYHHLLEVAS